MAVYKAVPPRSGSTSIQHRAQATVNSWEKLHDSNRWEKIKVKLIMTVN